MDLNASATAPQPFLRRLYAVSPAQVVLGPLNVLAAEVGVTFPIPGLYSPFPCLCPCVYSAAPVSVPSGSNSPVNLRQRIRRSRLFKNDGAERLFDAVISSSCQQGLGIFDAGGNLI